MRRDNLFYGDSLVTTMNVDEHFVVGNHQHLHCDGCDGDFYFHPDVLSLLCPDCDPGGDLLFEGEDYLRVIVLGEEE